MIERKEELLDPKRFQDDAARSFRQVEFVALLKNNGDKVYNFAWRLAGNEQDAWDLFQETLMKAYSHFESYDQSRPFDSWLFKILQNVYLDERRRNSRKTVASLDAPSPISGKPWEEILSGTDLNPLERLSKEENADLVQKALAGLPPLYRSAVILCDMEGLSYDAIAEVMDCPLGTVRSRVHQARLLLKKAFEDLSDTLSPDKQLQ
jgi:RNA polymerase sigma-70 factor (ECF subfamily)